MARRLAAEGHTVTYITLRQWDRGHDPSFGGVTVHGVGPRMGLYTESGRRGMGPPLVFGLGVFLHLVRRGRAYDVVHTCSFPYFSVLAAAAARPLHRYRLAVDWFEVWTRDYWAGYLGRLGRVGEFVQRACARVRQTAFCFSRLHAERLRGLGLRREAIVLRGLIEPAEQPDARVTVDAADAPIVVFAGRHIPEKRVPALVAAFARAREEIPELRLALYGDGPERAVVLRDIARLGLGDVACAPGFVPPGDVETALRRAACLVLPSEREGYGLVVVEAAELGTPSVVVAAADNAAVELIDTGVNGVVAPSAEADDLAVAILRVVRSGEEMRRSTAEWFERNKQGLSAAASLDAVVASYSAVPPRPGASARS